MALTPIGSGDDGLHNHRVLHPPAASSRCPALGNSSLIQNEPQPHFGLATSWRNVIFLQKLIRDSFVVAAQDQLRAAMRRLFPIAWLALFLLGQGALLLHKTDLDAHANGDTCEFCLLGSPLDHALTSSSTPPHGGLTLRFPPTRVHINPSPTYWYAFSPRAPPALLFSS